MKLCCSERYDLFIYVYREVSHTWIEIVACGKKTSRTNILKTDALQRNKVGSGIIRCVTKRKNWRTNFPEKKVGPGFVPCVTKKTQEVINKKKHVI